MQVSLLEAIFIRRKRNEETLNSPSEFIGCCTLAAIFAAVIYVVIQRTTMPSKVDAVYVEIAHEGQGSHGTHWSDIKENQPTILRVTVSKSDSGELHSAISGQERIEIKHPVEDGIVYATLDKEDPGLAPMVLQLQKGNWKDVPLTLRICYPGTATDGKVIRIADVVEEVG